MSLTTSAATDLQRLLPLVERLLAMRTLDRSAWPPDLAPPERFGLRVEAGTVSLPADIELLDPGRITAALTQRAAGWLRSIDVHAVIGSTNTELMMQAARGTIDGMVRLAELQLSGRGRRGREWFSPFGANLAVSLGFAGLRPAARLGGLSLVVGLAVIDALEQSGVEGLSLKWPNDVLLNGDKLGGILIEIASTGRGIELVVGIGLNVRLPAVLRDALDQPVADLADAGVSVERNRIAARVISSVFEFLTEFQRLGFAPFRAAFEARHAYHHRNCQIIQGDGVVRGRVEGVDDDGALLLRTDTGLLVCHGGEVSLRPGG